MLILVDIEMREEYNKWHETRLALSGCAPLDTQEKTDSMAFDGFCRTGGGIWDIRTICLRN